jgi:phenylacetate-CoA ligase
LTKPQVLIATPSFGEYLIEKTPSLLGKEAKELGIKWFFCAGEPGGGIPAVRKRLREGFNARVFDHTGGGHAFHGICCGDREYRGMHFISPDHCILELIDPETKKPVEIEDGSIGEMVFTFIDWEGGPFLRYVLGDMLQIFTKPCECGFPGIRFNILGRGDDMLIVKGVNIYPAAIKDAVSRFHPRTTGALKILLRQPGPLVKPPLRMKVEHGESVRKEQLNPLKEEIESFIRDNLRVNPEIDLVPPGSIPRDKGKVNLIETLQEEDKKQ